MACAAGRADDLPKESPMIDRLHQFVAYLGSAALAGLTACLLSSPSFHPWADGARFVSQMQGQRECLVDQRSDTFVALPDGRPACGMQVSAAPHGPQRQRPLS
jgi:hypothetical protein